jgi:hypothetical protein
MRMNIIFPSLFSCVFPSQYGTVIAPRSRKSAADRELKLSVYTSMSYGLARGVYLEISG